MHPQNKTMKRGIIYQDRKQRTIAVWRIVQRSFALLRRHAVGIDSEQVFFAAYCPLQVPDLVIYFVRCAR